MMPGGANIRFGGESLPGLRCRSPGTPNVAVWLILGDWVNRADHENVVTTADGNFYGALYAGLTFNVLEIDFVMALLIEEGLAIEASGFDRT
jgi:hypothetical protein